MSTPLVNGSRGEVALRIGATDLVVAAEIGRLAALSTALGHPCLEELYARLIGAEVAATVAAVRHLCVRGDIEAALAGMRLSDFPAAKAAIMASLSHHLAGPAGKDAAAGEGAAAMAVSSHSLNG